MKSLLITLENLEYVLNDLFQWFFILGLSLLWLSTKYLIIKSVLQEPESILNRSILDLRKGLTQVLWWYIYIQQHFFSLIIKGKIWKISTEK